MDAEIKQKWVKALRSGEYKQGQGSLKVKRGDDFLYCCMGVLLEVCGIPSELSGSKDHIVGNTYRYPDKNGNSGYPPADFRKKIGLYHETELSIKNDTEKLSFSEIADYIEKEL